MDPKPEYNAAAPQYNQQPVVQPDYRQPPAAPASMAYQSNASSQQLNEKNHTHGGQNKWAFGFWDCCSPMDICCMGYWCPCILFGRTQERNQGTDANPSGMGMMCCAWYGLTFVGSQSILQAIQRNNYRKQHNIEGSGVMDCLGSWCCPCSGLVQEEKESLLKKTGIDPKTKQTYQAPQGMSYP